LVEHIEKLSYEGAANFTCTQLKGRKYVQIHIITVSTKIMTTIV